MSIWITEDLVAGVRDLTAAVDRLTAALTGHPGIDDDSGALGETNDLLAAIAANLKPKEEKR